MNDTVGERLDALELEVKSRPAWISMGPEPHHALRIETAERVLQLLREHHQEAFSAALSEVMTGQPIHISKPRARKP